MTVDSSTPIVEISRSPAVRCNLSRGSNAQLYGYQHDGFGCNVRNRGTNADKFSLGTKTDNTIVVSAKGDNTRIRQPIRPIWLPKLPVRRLQRFAPEAGCACGDEGPAYLWTLASGDMTTAGGTVTKVSLQWSGLHLL